MPMKMLVVERSRYNYVLKLESMTSGTGVQIREALSLNLTCYPKIYKEMQ